MGYSQKAGDCLIGENYKYRCCIWQSVAFCGFRVVRIATNATLFLNGCMAYHFAF